MTLSFRLQVLVAAAGLALVTAAGVLLAPVSLIEAIVGRAHVTTFVPAAAPPLGLTARLLLAAGGAIAVAVGFAALMLLLDRNHRLRRRRARAARSADVDAPVLRRGDSHPDAPARRPLALADLDAGPGAGEAASAPSESEDLVLQQDEALDVLPDRETPILRGDEAIGELLVRLERGATRHGRRAPALTPTLRARADTLLGELRQTS